MNSIDLEGLGVHPRWDRAIWAPADLPELTEVTDLLATNLQRAFRQTRIGQHFALAQQTEATAFFGVVEMLLRINVIRGLSDFV